MVTLIWHLKCAAVHCSLAFQDLTLASVLHLQTCTVFKDGKRFSAKPYKFKMQSVSEDGERRKTFAKTTIDLAMYCKDISGTNSQEVVIHLE